MATHTRVNTTQYRTNVTWRVYAAIVRRTCYHVDAWIIQAADDALYLVMEGRAGGLQLVTRRVYACAPGSLTPYESDVEGVTRHIDSPWARRYAPWLNTLHWELIQPVLRIQREGFKGHVSVKLHYVHSDHAHDDPTEGFTNLYDATPRAARDAARMKVQQHRAAYPAVTSAWNATERSVLRTLDKLIKPNSDKID